MISPEVLDPALHRAGPPVCCSAARSESTVARRSAPSHDRAGATIDRHGCFVRCRRASRARRNGASCRVLALLACAVVAPRGTRADDIVTGDKNLTRVRILGLSRGKLDFRLPDGRMRSLWLDDIDLIQVDRGAAFADLNQAERMRAEGRAEQSLSRYRRAMRLTEGFWSEIVPARFLIAADQAGDVATATDLFVRVTQGRTTGPAAAVRMFPTHLPTKRNGKIAAALGAVNAALGRDVDDAERAVLTVFRYRILRRIGDGAGLAEAQRVAGLVIPESVRTIGVYDAIRSTLGVLVEQSSSLSDTLVWLDRAIRDCPPSALPDFLLLKSDALRKQATTDDDWIRASWPALRVGIHFPSDPRAGIGYYDAAVALEHAGRTGHVPELLHLCLERAPDRGTVAASARAMLARLAPRTEGDPR